MMSVVSTAHELVSIVPGAEADDDNSSSCSHGEEGEVMYKVNASQSDSEQNQGKDSGIDCGPEIFVVPDEETAKKIRDAVEYYLSDANILKDPFLLKHVRRNKEGFVSLKLISSFRKIRSLSRSWKAVAYSIQKSEILALNSEGTKVRRLVPLPDYDETVQSRTVIVYDLPVEKLSVENVSEIFSKCGDIALVRILRPGGSVNQDIKRFFAKNPEVQSKDCGLVEFEEFAGVQKALALCCGKKNGPRVMPLVTREAGEKAKAQSPPKSESKSVGSPKKDSPKKKKKSKRSLLGSAKNCSVDDSESEVSYKKDQRSRSSSSGSLGYGSSGSSGYLSSSPADNWFLRRHSYNTSGKHLETSTSSFASLGNRNLRGSRDRLNKEKKDSEKSYEPAGSQSPWRRRRELLSESSPALFSSPESSRLPVKAIRLPKGPDGTTGFHLRTRIPLPSTAE